MKSQTDREGQQPYRHLQGGREGGGSEGGREGEGGGRGGKGGEGRNSYGGRSMECLRMITCTNSHNKSSHDEHDWMNSQRL